MRKLDLTLDARKFLQDLDAKRFKQIVNKVFDLMRDPSPADSQTLRGYPYQRADVGEYRIVYRFDDETLWILLVGKRNDDEVYKELKRKE